MRRRFAKWSDSDIRVFLRATRGPVWRRILRPLRVDAAIELTVRAAEKVHADNADKSGPYSHYGVN